LLHPKNAHIGVWRKKPARQAFKMKNRSFIGNNFDAASADAYSTAVIRFIGSKQTGGSFSALRFLSHFESNRLNKFSLR
jgi:hypothetical protein